jgi:hypothetical protein
MKIYMFRIIRVSIIRSLFIVRSAGALYTRAGQGRSCSNAVYNPVWHKPLLSVQWINSWWWTDELSETCRVSWQNEFAKLVHLVDFTAKKFVTMHVTSHERKKSKYVTLLTTLSTVILYWVKHIYRAVLCFERLLRIFLGTNNLRDEKGLLLRIL